MSVDPDPWSSVHQPGTMRTSDVPRTTGDDGVDQILADFASVGTQAPPAQVEAAESAHRRLQARLSSS